MAAYHIFALFVEVFKADKYNNEKKEIYYYYYGYYGR